MRRCMGCGSSFGSTDATRIFEALVWDYFFHLLRTDRYVRAFVKSKAPKIGKS